MVYFSQTFSPKSNVPPFYNDFIRHGRVSQLNPFLSGKWGKGKIEYSSRGKKVCPSFVFLFFYFSSVVILGRLRSFNEIAIPGEVELRV